MKIGMDFDGFIADGAVLKSTVLREHHLINIPPELCKRKFAVKRGYLTDVLYEELLREIYEIPDTHARIPPVPGAIEGIRDLQRLGHQTHIVTARDPIACGLVEPWLAKHDLYIPHTCVGRTGTKTEACKGFDAFVDDDLLHLLPLKGVVPRLYLFGQQPGIRASRQMSGIRRALDWNQLREHLFRQSSVA